MTTPSDPVLCRRLGTTASQLQGWISAQATDQIAEFLKARFEERYFHPIESMEANQKNGFLIMAIACLTIEALESFHQGWPSTQRLSKAAFVNFLTREPRFKAFAGYAEPFYSCVRCGILHQAETQAGWKVRRQGTLFDESSLTINATRFHRELHGSLLDYINELKRSPYGSLPWINAEKKLRVVLANCEVKTAN
jgi:hypothetical protein